MQDNSPLQIIQRQRRT